MCLYVCTFVCPCPLVFVCRCVVTIAVAFIWHYCVCVFVCVDANCLLLPLMGGRANAMTYKLLPELKFDANVSHAMAMAVCVCVCVCLHCLLMYHFTTYPFTYSLQKGLRETRTQSLNNACLQGTLNDWSQWKEEEEEDEKNSSLTFNVFSSVGFSLWCWWWCTHAWWFSAFCPHAKLAYLSQ